MTRNGGRFRIGLIIIEDGVVAKWWLGGPRGMGELAIFDGRVQCVE